MKYDQEKLDGLAKKCVELRDKAHQSENAQQEFTKFQNSCISEFQPLIYFRAAKYKKFSNYPDLVQDGLEALTLALKTYQCNRGSFTYWADCYIKTKICRKASAHSTIRIPMKQGAIQKPYKTSTFPVMLDLDSNPEEMLQKNEAITVLNKLIAKLPQPDVINYFYGINGRERKNLSTISKMLGMSRQECYNLIEMYKVKLKKMLDKMN